MLSSYFSSLACLREMLIENPMPLSHPQALEKREERAFGHEPRVGALPPGGKSTCIAHTSVAVLYC